MILDTDSLCRHKYPRLLGALHILAILSSTLLFPFLACIFQYFGKYMPSQQILSIKILIPNLPNCQLVLSIANVRVVGYGHIENNSLATSLKLKRTN